MVYFKSSQPVPGKGDAWTYYECDDKMNIARHVTNIPATGETRSVANPIVKRLTDMYMMQMSSKDEFDTYWVEPDEEGEGGEMHSTFQEGMHYFSPDMTIGEAMAIHPRVAEVFAAFRLGGCSHCGVNQYETVGQVCMGYGVDIDVLLEVLEDLVRPKQSQEAAPTA